MISTPNAVFPFGAQSNCWGRVAGPTVTYCGGSFGLSSRLAGPLTDLVDIPEGSMIFWNNIRDVYRGSRTNLGIYYRFS